MIKKNDDDDVGRHKKKEKKKITKLKFHVQENIDDDNNDGISFWCALAHSLSPFPKYRRRNTKCIEEIQNFISKPPRPRKISFT